MPESFKCLILEDDLSLAETLVTAIELNGGKPFICQTVEQARKMAKEQEFKVFVLDQYLPDGTGGDFFSYLRDHGNLAPCIMLTGVPEIDTAVELTRGGLFDYLTKPLDALHFSECLNRALQTKSSIKIFGIIDNSPAMKRVRQLIDQAAANPTTTVLLAGETGVGKDVVARLIHQLTFQKNDTARPLISLNCSTLPADMFEAELFGAQKGAYTGSHQNRVGLAEAAKGGTLFLDEIAEVPMILQPKLLQFLETGEFRRLGSIQSIKFEGRIIAATHKSLENEVREQRFREDLWYRLDVFNIRVPPLRDRKEDIPALIEVLLESLSQKCGRKKTLVTPKDLQRLQAYQFPGNVRELRNILERSLVQTPRDAQWLQIFWNRQVDAEPTASVVSDSKSAPVASGRTLSLIEQQEYEIIRKTLNEAPSLRQAATRLGLSLQALLRRVKKWPELRNK